MTQNINGFGVKSILKKSNDIREWINDSEVDILGTTETNVNWKKVGKKG